MVHWEEHDLTSVMFQFGMERMTLITGNHRQTQTVEHSVKKKKKLIETKLACVSPKHQRLERQSGKRCQDGGGRGGTRTHGPCGPCLQPEWGSNALSDIFELVDKIGVLALYQH